MRKFTKVCLIITLCFTIVGILFCGVGVAAGVSSSQLHDIAQNNGFSINRMIQAIRGHFSYNYPNYDSEDSTETGSYDNTYSKQYKASAVRNLDFDMKAGELTLVDGGDSEEVTVEVESKNCSINTSLDGDTLTIRGNSRDTIFNNYKLHITVKIPDKLEFDEINIDANAGEVDLSAFSLKSNTAALNVDAGQLTVGKINTTDTLDISVGAGEADVADASANDVNLDSGMGHISYTGEVTGDLDASCGVGEVDIELVGDERDYNYDLSCGVGEINAGGHSYSALSDDMEIDNNSDRTISLDCGVGQIDVTFR